FETHQQATYAELKREAATLELTLRGRGHAPLPPLHGVKAHLVTPWIQLSDADATLVQGLDLGKGLSLDHRMRVVRPYRGIPQAPELERGRWLSPLAAEPGPLGRAASPSWSG
ncbi:MAG: hypothetical protein AAGG01_23470, partial [Planctomycetota bacterium]